MAARLPLVAVLALTSAVAALPLRADSSQTGGLKIVVIEREDAVNVIQQKTAVAPVVEIRDRNDLPVAGVPVTFTITGAKSASFAGGAQTITVTTNAAGRAAVSALTPLSNGTVQINVQAAFQAQTATATITQTNFATAAQAAGAGGGLSNVAIVGIVGAAAAGGLVALKGGDTPSAPANAAPQIPGVVASPSTGLLNSTTIAFSDLAVDPDGDALTHAWDFGDGTTSTLPRPTHIYSREGAFTVQLTVRDAAHSATNQTTVIIKSMTGRWRLGTTSNFYDLTQTGATITGVFSAGPGVRTVAGSVRTTSPYVTFSETAILPQIPPATSVATFTGDPSADVNVVSGVFNGGGFPANTAAGISRQ